MRCHVRLVSCREGRRTPMLHRLPSMKIKPCLKMRLFLKKRGLFAVTLFLGGLAYTAASANELDKGEKKALLNHAEAGKSQQRIDQMDDATREVRAEYLANERTADVTEAYNRETALLVQSQEQELADLQMQLDSIAETDQAMLPMLSRMVDALRQFVAADLPFLPEERQKRLQKLDDLLLRADVSVAEKYRQILEAYKVEVQYGRTFEAYRGALPQAGEPRQVNFLRLGRTALYFQTLNGEESGLWQPSQQRWQALTEAQTLTLRKAIQIARQQKVPELIDLELPRPKASS